MNKTEKDSLKAFRKEHARCGSYGVVTTIKDGNIGSFVNVECIYCRAKKEITDYSSW